MGQREDGDCVGAEDQAKGWGLDERWRSSQKVEVGRMLGSTSEAGGWWVLGIKLRKEAR